MKSKINFGVIGAGRIGKVHAGTIVQNIQHASVLAIADPNTIAAKEVAGLYEIGLVCDNYREIIDHPDIDAVVICSPTDTHAAYIVEAARAGKHIFCEKPLDLTLNAIKSAIEEVRRHGVKLMVGFNRRFDPNFQKIYEMVTAGKIGDPYILKITSRDPAPPPAEYVEGSGGMFLDMTMHDFDMARFVVGSEVTEVYTKAAVLIDPAIGKAGDVDTAIITLSFENGAIGVIDNSRKAVYGYDQRLEMFGSLGMVNVDNNYPDNHLYYTIDGVHKTLPLNFFMDRYLEAYAREMQEFCDAIQNDKEPSVTGFDGLMAVAIAIAAKKSQLEERPVKLSEILTNK